MTMSELSEWQLNSGGGQDGGPLMRYGRGKEIIILHSSSESILPGK
jgi:hypothetical protein